MYVKGVKSGVYGFYATLYIQSNVTHVRTVESELYFIYRAPPPPRGRLIVAFSPLGLAVHQSVRGGSFVNFLGLIKIQG